ncbi:hypothetical protein O0L34_g15259 [Tuta absoluta]|nr:hypothetical protein O0L34_g15259 [Tuta absoluta]
MYFPLVFLGAVAVASAWPETNYKTILQKGLDKQLDTYTSFKIPNGNCVGFISTSAGIGDAPKFRCARWWQHVVTLQVSADDINASPDIKFMNNLNEAYITRKGSCYGESLVKIGFTCASFGDVEKDAVGDEDIAQTKPKVGNRRDKSNRRILNQSPNQYPPIGF